MKFYVLLMVVVGIVVGVQVHDNGQPGCKTNLELKVRNYRNVWDPTRFWVCEQLGQAARVEWCPYGTGWLDSKKLCVDWIDWIWEEPIPPPSKP